MSAPNSPSGEVIFEKISPKAQDPELRYKFWQLLAAYASLLVAIIGIMLVVRSIDNNAKSLDNNTKSVRNGVQ